MDRPPKQKRNVIQMAVSSWLDSLSPSLLQPVAEKLSLDPGKDHQDTKQLLLSSAPKRWVVYEPMVLLPSGSFTTSSWLALLTSLDLSQKEALWTAILRQLSPSNKPPLTHLAINEGIPLHLSSRPLVTEGDNPEPADRKEENLLRSPTHLHPLYGFFGNPSSSSNPTPSDYDAALWVTTKQNSLIQTWAPLHTMFSRGNVKEKARLLTFPKPKPQPTQDHHDNAPREEATQPAAAGAASVLQGGKGRLKKKEGNVSWEKYAVDLYAGIGYFVLSYARLGLRVLCWELNPWSVEGLRRGAAANGFSVRVVVAAPPPSPIPCSSSSSPPPSFSTGTEGDCIDTDWEDVLAGREQIVVFLEDNRHAADRIRVWRERKVEMEVVHVNCGFLPSSMPVWRDAWEIIMGGGSGSCGGGEGEGEGKAWLHLHENVGVADIEARRAEIQGLFGSWTTEEGQIEGSEGRKTAKVEHVELVKTYAPGVWHCVFDVSITRSSAGG
ncbi:hypothetical protein VTI28DRAFT_7730 [Corynascus sepedonium]